MLGVQGFVWELNRTLRNINICKILSHSALITQQAINMNREALSFFPLKNSPYSQYPLLFEPIHLSALLMVRRDYKPWDGCTPNREQHDFGLLTWRKKWVSFFGGVGGLKSWTIWHLWHWNFCPILSGY